MAREIVVLTLLSTLIIEGAEAADAVSDSLLARKFSPILVLTEEKPGRIRLPSTASQGSTTRKDDWEANKRIVKKMVFGSLSSLVVAGVSLKVMVELTDPNPGDAFHDLGLFLHSTAIGCSSGFPLGVTLADPHDSFYKTLLAGVTPAVVGYFSDYLNIGDGGFFLIYVAPVLTSLMASELWRKPLEHRRVSLSLSPTPHGGLSAVANLRF